MWLYTAVYGVYKSRLRVVFWCVIGDIIIIYARKEITLVILSPSPYPSPHYRGVIGTLSSDTLYMHFFFIFFFLITVLS